MSREASTKRTRAVELHRKGNDVGQISEWLGVARSDVRKWLNAAGIPTPRDRGLTEVRERLREVAPPAAVKWNAYGWRTRRRDERCDYKYAEDRLAEEDEASP